MTITNSLLTNPSSMTALRTMNGIERGLSITQNRVSTGLKVSGALDDASNFSIAQGLRTEIRAINTINQGLSAAKGSLGVAIAGAEAISNVLIELRSKVIEAGNPAITSSQYGILQADILKLVDSIDEIQQNAVFNGLNLLTGDDVGTIENAFLEWHGKDIGTTGTIDATDFSDYHFEFEDTDGSNGGGSMTMTSAGITNTTGFSSGSTSGSTAGGSYEVGTYPLGQGTKTSADFRVTVDGETISGLGGAFEFTEEDILSNLVYEFAGNFVARGSDYTTVTTSVDGPSMRIYGQGMSVDKLFPARSRQSTWMVGDPAQNNRLAAFEVAQALDTVNSRLGYLGSVHRQIEGHIQSNQAALDATENGLGNIVDADMAKESAKLTSMQIQQQLSVQTLGIANNRPQSIVGLFG